MLFTKMKYCAISKLLLILSFTICANSLSISKNALINDDCNLSQDVVDDIAKYTGVTNKILDYFIKGPYKGQTWNQISNFVDKFGPRLTGTKDLEDAIDFVVQAATKNNLENIHTEDLNVPYWLRGEESVTVIEPVKRNLPMLGLGTSVGTGPNGLTADVIVVESFDELNGLPIDKTAGRIVVYCETFIDYSTTVSYRRNGAAEAAKKGAVAALIKSIAPFSIASPHTGSQYYQANVTKIPVAAITHEDADFLLREQRRGNRIRINIKMSPTETTTVSRNFIAELKGSAEPDKIVMLSAHIDSWDVGVGAMDDAGGCFISLLAPTVLKELNLRPKRTLRTVLFTAEEEGVIGANVYAEKHKDENDKLNFVMESDFGTFAPLGLLYGGSKEGECLVREVLKHFSSINASALVLGNPGPDIKVWVDQGVPGGGLYNANDQYFWFHHSMGDRMNVLNSEVMDRNAGFWTAVSYIIADMKYDIPRGAE